MKFTLEMNMNGEKETLNVDMTMHSARIYRQTFGRDMLKDMGDIYVKLQASLFDGISLEGVDVNKSDDEIYNQLLEKVNVSKLITDSNGKNLDFEETERGCQIIWAFAKNADDSIPNYTEWIDSFDYILPVGDIITSLYEHWHSTAVPTVEIKN